MFMLLSVSLFHCLRHYSVMDLMEFSGNVENNIKNKCLEFSDDKDHWLELGTF